MNTQFIKMFFAFWRRGVFLCTIAACFSVLQFLAAPGVSWAGFIVASPPAATPLDGQDVDWITIKANSSGVLGLGTLSGGTLSVGVEPVLSGDFTIEGGSSFNADQIGAGSSGMEQYSGTVNLGKALVIKTGGQVILNQDTLNATGRSDADYGESLRMSGGSLFDAYWSDLTFKHDVVVGTGSSMDIDEGTFIFGDKLILRDSGTVTMTGVTAKHQNLLDPENVGRVIVESNSTLNLANSTLEIVSGGGDSTDGQNILIKSGGKVLATDTQINARRVSSDNLGSLYSQTGGSLNTHGLTSGDGGEILLNTTSVDSKYISVNGQLDATATTLNLTGDNFSGTYGITTLTDSTLNITGGGDIDLMGTSKFTATDTDITADVFLTRDTAEVSISSSSNSELNVRTFSSTGTNTIDITGYDVNIAEFFDIGVNNGTGAGVNLIGSSLEARDARILNSTVMTTDGSDITFRNGGYIDHSSLTLTNSSSLSFEDELFIDNLGSMTVTGSTLGQKNDADTTDESRGSIVVRNNGSLNLNAATVDLSTGDEGKINIYNQGTVTAAQSDITANHVVINNNNSKMDISDTSLTAESLTVSDGAKFIAIDSNVHITGNTTTIETGGELFINGESYNEDGNLIVTGGTLNASDVAIIVGGDMTVTGGASVFVDELFIGDDFLFDPDGTGSFSMDATWITMLGTSDDEGDGHMFNMDSNILLGGLNVAKSVDLILTQSLMVTDLSIFNSGSIDLNGFDLTVSSQFSGNLEQIITTHGGNFIYNPKPVPEPSTLLLLGLGILWFAKTGRKRNF